GQPGRGGHRAAAAAGLPPGHAGAGLHRGHPGAGTHHGGGPGERGARRGAPAGAAGERAASAAGRGGPHGTHCSRTCVTAPFSTVSHTPKTNPRSSTAVRYSASVAVSTWSGIPSGWKATWVASAAGTVRTFSEALRT